MSESEIGSVIIDLEGTEITLDELELLEHPMVAGVILFSRNYAEPNQIKEVCRLIRAFRRRPTLIAVDQEGGRVQRFKKRFTQLPSLQEIGTLYTHNKKNGERYAELAGWLMAKEVLSVGVDLSLAPVLDLNKLNKSAIGDRAFHDDPAVVSHLGRIYTKGMRDAGMAVTAKHFPGHGSVITDSHFTSPIDGRPLHDIESEDLKPFLDLISNGVDAIMPAHIIYTEIDEKKVAYSEKWLQKLLREKYKFDGTIISDDLNMQGASLGDDDYIQRAWDAFHAGCDLLLVCNNRPAAISILEGIPQDYFFDMKKYDRLKGKFKLDHKELKTNSEWNLKHDEFSRIRDNFKEFI